VVVDDEAEEWGPPPRPPLEEEASAIGDAGWRGVTIISRIGFFIRFTPCQLIEILLSCQSTFSSVGSVADGRDRITC
jgi:hypothetical protein